MFTPTHAGLSKPQARILAASLALHGLLLGWILYNPPRFLTPSSVAAGEYGGVATRLYLPSHFEHGADATMRASAVTDQDAVARKKLAWKKSHELKKSQQPPAALSPDDAAVQASQAAKSNPAPPAGLPSGTSQGGDLSGDEIRPALPLSATDPVVDGTDLAGHGEGSVVVEITIDDKGNIVQKVVLQSLGPAIDNKVLAALETWHFSPATRNGVAIPSKQDVYYHFKPNG